MSYKYRNTKTNLIPLKTGRYDMNTERTQNVIGRGIAQARSRAGLSLEKFRVLLEDYGISLTAAAIQKWEVGKSVPNAYQLIAIYDALHIEGGLDYFRSTHPIPELNEEGQQRLNMYKEDLIASGRYKPQTAPLTIIRYIEMPVSCLSASAGTGEFLEEGKFEMVSIPEGSVPNGADFGIRVNGDSMEPVYQNGQIVWVQETTELRPGEVGIFSYDGEGYIKLYTEQLPDEASLEAYTDSNGLIHKQPVLVSYNQKYAPKVVSPHLEFRIVGRVL